MFLRIVTICFLFPGVAVFAEDTGTSGMQQSPLIPQSTLLAYLADQSTMTLIDARSEEEFAKSHIDGAVNLPHDADADVIGDLDLHRDKPIAVYCKTGNRAQQLHAVLQGHGFTDVRILKPQQIFWSESFAVFNCGVPTSETIDTFSTTVVVQDKE